MKTKQSEKESIHISQENLLAIVRSILDESRGYPSDLEPTPPGPWDPVIRTALEKSRLLDPQPQPWRSLDSIFGTSQQLLKIILERHPELGDLIGPIFGDKVALNPQPLPPRFAYMISLAQTVINRAELLQDVAGVMQLEDEKQGIIVVGGYISRFVKDVRDDDFTIRWPFPWPPPYWIKNEINGIDLVVMATQFEKAGIETFHPELRQSLINASEKLVEAAVSKMNLSRK